MLVGDYEDAAGKPFVGPAGKIMDRALEEAGIDRDKVYVTNTVKHFKWEPRGKRRIHQKPNSREIAACRHWLEAELRLVKPKLLVCLGATAAQAIFGPSFRVTRERSKVLSSKFAPKVVATVHPSSLLRQPDEEYREREYAHFVADLRVSVKSRRYFDLVIVDLTPNYGLADADGEGEAEAAALLLFDFFDSADAVFGPSFTALASQVPSVFFQYEPRTSSFSVTSAMVAGLPAFVIKVLSVILKTRDDSLLAIVNVFAL